MGGKGSGKKPKLKTEKVCSWCTKEKPLYEFYSSKSRGYNPIAFCIPCDKEVAVLRSIKRRLTKEGRAKIEAEIEKLLFDIERKKFVLSGEFDKRLSQSRKPPLP